MKSHSLALTALLFTAALGASPAAQAPAPILAVEQLSFIRLYGCGEYYSSPPCLSPVLADLDGNHAIDMPSGEWSPDGRQLLITRDGDIHAASAAGGTSLNLTNFPGSDYAPRWSPDGARIAFASTRDGASDLYVMNADGTNVVRLHTGGSPWSPTWSPDSTRIAFTCVVDPLAPVNYDICSVNADGSALARLTNAPGSEYGPDWSPGGERILFTDGTNGEHLVVMNADGSNATLVNHSGLAEQPRWSPDGTRIAYVSFFWVEFGDPTPSRFVTIMNADGTGVVDLGWGDSPVWRPSVGGVNYRPVASYSFQCDGPTCTLDGSASSDSDGTIVEYGWRFPDGTIATGVTVTHTFTSLTRWVSLTVMDDDAALARIVQAVNQPPVAAFSAHCLGRTCTFDGSSSTDPDANLWYFSWSFGDGGSQSGTTVSHLYPATGTYMVTLTVTDYSYATDSHTEAVIVGTGNTAPIATFWASCSLQTCQFNGSASFDPEGGPLTYLWNFGDATAGAGAIVSHTFGADGTLAVTLTVTDSGGLKGTYTSNVFIAPPTSGYLHVGDLSGARATQKNTWTPTVRAHVHGDVHTPVTNAVVSGAWSTGHSGSCTTGLAGYCDISHPALPTKSRSVSFTITSVSRAGYGYAAAKNHDPDAQSGTTITITR